MAEILYLSDANVAACGLGMDKVVEIVLDAYRCKGRGGVEMPPKPAVHPSPDSQLHAMPAYIQGLQSVGMKWIGTFPSNGAKGLPVVSGLIVLNNPETGLPLCVMDCRRVTAMRTGAKTAATARYLARPSSHAVGIVGCGVQGRSNLDALACEFEIEIVHAFDVDESAAKRFAEEVSRSRFDVRVVASAEEAIREMDIVVTSSPIRSKPEPVAPASWLNPGGFYAPVDYDSFFTGDAMMAMDLFVTDDTAQFEYYRSLGYFLQAPPMDRVHDLGAVVSGAAPRRTGDDQLTMAMNLGIGMDDVAVAMELYRCAKRKGLGTVLEL
jgi:ornithine cyclodeaminase/alanine dehydrogenase